MKSKTFILVFLIATLIVVQTKADKRSFFPMKVTEPNGIIIDIINML